MHRQFSKKRNHATMTNSEKEKPLAGSLLHISTSPHIRQKGEVPSIMLSVIIALTPAFIGSIFFFGIRSLALTFTCVASAVASEWLLPLIFKKQASFRDLSAVVTGMLLALSLPPTLPLWMAATGSVFAITVSKMAFGGLGNNFINPAFSGRAFLMISYPTAMTQWIAPLNGSINGLAQGLDGISNATPLMYYKNAIASGNFHPLDFQDVLPNIFWGNTGGCIGATSAALLILGALFLWYKRIIGFGIPASLIGTVFILSWIFNGTGYFLTSEALIVPFYQILTGGIMLGGLFMANDPVTRPISVSGRLVFGTCCGALTFFLRKFGGSPEGICYAILLMNCCTPLIDKTLRPKRYGEVKTK
jgi:Na+-translocating ferredoxin:NAD+ oxidoreductase subunit D